LGALVQEIWAIGQFFPSEVEELQNIEGIDPKIAAAIDAVIR
jgi:hypothetical protein